MYKTAFAKRGLSVLMSLLLALGCCVIAAAAEDAPHYVVLGDSIAFGSGLSNPRQAVYGRIVADTNGYAYDNFAVPGHTTQNLLQRMQNEQVKTAIADADIISISIGGNNFLLLKNGDGFTMFNDAKVINQGVAIDNEVLIDYIVEDLGGTIGEEYADLYGQGRITVTDGE